MFFTGNVGEYINCNQLKWRVSNPATLDQKYASCQKRNIKIFN